MRCPNCDLVFLERSRVLPEALERAQYDLHENVVEDGRYQSFMEPLVKKVLSLGPGLQVLDFGCGPTSVCAHLLRPQGYDIALYDKFYFSSEAVLRKTYDVIIASEVVEHFHDPNSEFSLLSRLLRTGGHLIIGTSLTDDVADFSRWAYARDPTHISLFSRATMTRVSEMFGFSSPEFFSGRGILMEKLS